MIRAVAGALALVLAAGGCLRPPRSLSGEVVDLPVSDARSDRVVGTRVRWGGEIVSTTPESDVTCFEIVSLPLDRRAEPYQSDASDGRFIACAPGFYDPAIYAPERRLTVVGTVDAPTAGQIGARAYEFARVRADGVHLWPEAPAAPAVVYAPWPGPFWYPYYGGWYGWP